MIQPAPAPSISPAQQQKIWKAAQDFEAMAVDQMLAPMFATIDQSKGPFGGGEAESAWRPMLITAMAKQIEARGGLGLAGPVMQQMLQMQEKQHEHR